MIVGSFGYGGSAWFFNSIRETIELNGNKLVLCHEHNNADIQYRKETVKSFIDSLDAVILLSREDQPAKSVNRLALAWSRRKPVIVSPLDAYLRYGQDGDDFLVAKSFDEVPFLIEKLKNDPLLAKRIADNGFNKALMIKDSLSSVNYGPKYIRAINRSILPKVHVAIPHYLNRSDYIEDCVNSVLNSKGVDIIVSIASSSKKELSFSDSRVKLYQNPNQKMSFSQATNKAISNVDDDTDYILLLNDDTIVSEYSISRMIEVSRRNNDAVVNPLSNCDKGWLHNYNIEIGEKSLVPAMSIEEFSSEEKEILGRSQFSDLYDLNESTFVAFYSTLIPKKVWDDVGVLNEDFLSGGEDFDYCQRAKFLGTKVGWTHCAFVFHYGGKSRKQSHDIRGVEHELEDKYNNDLMYKKWPKNKKKIAIWTGPAWETWNIDSPYTTGIGGSEYCAGHLAKTLASNSYDVTMYGDHLDKIEHGVKMKHWSSLRPEQEYFDTFICSRQLEPIRNIRANNIIVWVHDIFCQGGQYLDPTLVSKVSKFFCLSEWHINFFSNYHGVNKDKIEIIPNGMNTSLLKFDESKKVYGKMHYSSSPDRGLDNLLYMLPYIREEVPEIHLDVYYGFHNYEKSVLSRNNKLELDQLKSLKGSIEKCKGFVHFKDRVNLLDLHEAWSKAYVWGYPTIFSETYCLTAKEAQYSGTPIVCSNVGALSTTVGEHGLQISDPYSKKGREEFINEIIKLHKNKDYWISRSTQSLNGAVDCDWETVYLKYWKKFLD